MLIIWLLFTIVTLLYVWIKWRFTFWKRNKVPGPEPEFFSGNIGPTINFTEHWGNVTAKWYRDYQNEPYIGYFKVFRPAIMLRDLDIIKNVLMKDFDYFRQNDVAVAERFDPLVAINPFFTMDEKWKEGRKTIVPVLSSSKIKTILPVMNSIGEELVNFIKQFPTDEEFCAKTLALRFTTANVIKCIFSIDAGCFKKHEESEFLECGRNLFAPSFLAGFKFILIRVLPTWIVNLIPAPILPKEMDRLFRNLVATNMASRSSNFQSNDILQMLVQIQNKYDIKDADFLPGHVLEIFFDGTETSSTAIGYTLYELAKYPDVQEKLYDEIMEMLNNNDGQLTPDGLQELPYLEGVLYESMRIHPPIMALQKICTKEYELPKNAHQTKATKILPGMPVNVPVYAIHMDPNYYPNPEEFKPERFSGEEQRKRHKCAFLGFGEGQRICVGLRFAMAQNKVALAYIVKHFQISLTPNQKPIVINPKAVISYPVDGIRIKFKQR